MSALERPVDARPYRRRMTRTWWLRNRRYALFMLRELSAVFLALFAVIYLAQLAMLAAGPDAYGDYLALLRSPWWVALHAVILVFALVHAFTWLWSVPAIAPARVAGRQVPRPLLIGGALAGWVVVSAVVIFVMVSA